MHKFAFWLIKTLNHIDLSYPDVIYILPENFVEIPFELFRASFRGGVPLYDTEE